MIPIIAAAVCLYAARSDNRAPKRPPVKAATPQPAAAPQPPQASTPITPKAQPRLTTDQYQQQFITPTLFTEPAAASCEYLVAQQFMGQYLSQPHITHVTLFSDVIREGAERIQAYQKWYDSPAGKRLWQICAIDSKYGHIYLSLQLNADNSIPVDTAGVLVTYDSEMMDHFITQTEMKQFERFGQKVFNYDKALKAESQLRLFLGDRWHPYPVSHYFD